MTGETSAQMVRRVRLHVAAGRLLRETVGVDRIGRDCGYPNPRSFSKAFGQAYGMTPRAFRETGRLGAPMLMTREERNMTYPIEILELPARRVAGLAHQGSYMSIGESFEKAWVIVAERQAHAQMGPAIGIYYDDPSARPEAELRSFAGAQWDGDAVPKGLEAVDIAGGNAAVLTFKGPYARLKDGYDARFGLWLPETGHMPADAPCYEIYLNDPRTTAPEDLLTEICLPLK
jgi:AraC family transcriptional regulator